MAKQVRILLDLPPLASSLTVAAPERRSDSPSHQLVAETRHPTWHAQGRRSMRSRPGQLGLDCPPLTASCATSFCLISNIVTSVGILPTSDKRSANSPGSRALARPRHMPAGARGGCENMHGRHQSDAATPQIPQHWSPAPLKSMEEWDLGGCAGWRVGPSDWCWHAPCAAASSAWQNMCGFRLRRRLWHIDVKQCWLGDRKV